MELLAIGLMIFAAVVIGSGFYGMVQAFRNRRREGHDALGESIEEIDELHELAEKRAQLVFQIRSVRLDEEAKKISAEEADRRVAQYERKAVRIAKRMDTLVGDETVREEAADELERYLEENADRADEVDWEWSEEALQRHGGIATSAGAERG
jgi:hypothetical protein